MFCGLLTVAYSLLIFIFMPDSPMEAKCLSDREKVIAVERLRANQMGIISREWRWDHVRETFYDLKTWCWFFLIVSISYVVPARVDLRLALTYAESQAEASVPSATSSSSPLGITALKPFSSTSPSGLSRFLPSSVGAGSPLDSSARAWSSWGLRSSPPLGPC